MNKINRNVCLLPAPKHFARAKNELLYPDPIKRYVPGTTVVAVFETHTVPRMCYDVLKH